MAITSASQARNAARHWVAESGVISGGVLGAFLHGSVNWLNDDDPFSPTSDVDVILVDTGPETPTHVGKFRHQGVLLDISYLLADELHTAEAVLGNSHLAGSLRGASLIADPTGRLTWLQAGIARDYAKREWVVRRCQHARDKILQHLNRLNESNPLHESANALLFGAGCTTHVLLVAGLRNPTVRRRYTAARELLDEYRLLDIHEELVTLLGSAQMNRLQVERHLEGMAAAFDSAKEIIRTPVFFASDFSDVARPIAIDGSRELIETDLHREAMFWIAATWTRCMAILSTDAPPELRDQFTPEFHAMLADLGIRSHADMARRSEQVLDYLPRLMSTANDIVSVNPEIT